MFKITVFNPIESNEEIKKAMFNAGAGKIGAYDYCCFEQKGRGQFRPLEGANPAVGEHGRLEFVEEIRVEMVCNDDKISQVIKAMKTAHPYEVPAYDVVRLEAY